MNRAAATRVSQLVQDACERVGLTSARRPDAELANGVLRGGVYGFDVEQHQVSGPILCGLPHSGRLYGLVARWPLRKAGQLK